MRCMALSHATAQTRSLPAATTTTGRFPEITSSSRLVVCCFRTQVCGWKGRALSDCRGAPGMKTWWLHAGSRVLILYGCCWQWGMHPLLTRILPVTPRGEHQKIAEHQPGGHYNGEELFQMVAHRCRDHDCVDHRSWPDPCALAMG